MKTPFSVCFLLAAVLFGCKREATNNLSVTVKNLPKQVITLDTGVQYAGTDSSFGEYTYNTYNQLIKNVQYVTYKSGNTITSIDSFEYYFQYADTLNSMPVRYHFWQNFQERERSQMIAIICFINPAY